MKNAQAAAIASRYASLAASHEDLSSADKKYKVSAALAPPRPLLYNSGMKFIKKYKNDIILITSVLIIAAVIFAVSSGLKSQGAVAVVTINGVEQMRLPLDVDTEIVLGEGEHTNMLVISDGKASVIEASCPDHICVYQGEIRYEGQSIVCLPNMTIITIEGGENSGLDTVVG